MFSITFGVEENNINKEKIIENNPSGEIKEITKVTSETFVFKTLKGEIIEAGEPYTLNNDEKCQDIKVYIDDKGHKATAFITYKMSFYEDTINHAKPLKKGEKIYVYTTFEEGKIIGTEVAYRDNTNNLIIILVLFILTVILIGGVKGIKSLIGLIVTIALIFYVLVPRNNVGEKSIIINIYSFNYNSNSIIYNNIRI